MTQIRCILCGKIDPKSPPPPSLEDVNFFHNLLCLAFALLPNLVFLWHLFLLPRTNIFYSANPRSQRSQRKAHSIFSYFVSLVLRTRMPNCHVNILNLISQSSQQEYSLEAPSCSHAFPTTIIRASTLGILSAVRASLTENHSVNNIRNLFDFNIRSTKKISTSTCSLIFHAQLFDQLLWVPNPRTVTFSLFVLYFLFFIVLPQFRIIFRL